MHAYPPHPSPRALQVANYPFTTIIPNLGVVDLEAFALGGDGRGMVRVATHVSCVQCTTHVTP